MVIWTFPRMVDMSYVHQINMTPGLRGCDYFR